MGLTGERLSVFLLSATHGTQHFLGRIFPPLIPLLAVDLALPLWKLGLVMTAWSLAVGTGQTPMGHLADRFDRRFILPTGVLVAGIGFVVVAQAPRIGASLPGVELFGTSLSGPLLVMVAGMVVAGVGKSATHPSGYPLLSAAVPPERKGKALGRWGGAAKVGDAAGPAFVAVALILLAWEQIFLLAGALAVVYAVVLFRYMTRSELETRPGNHQGEVDGSGDGSGSTVYRVTLLLVLASVVAGMVATRGIGTYLPEFITSVYGFSFTLFGVTLQPASVASIYFSVLLLAGAVSSMVVGSVVDRYDPRSVMMGLFLAATVALTGLAVLPLTPVTLLVVALFVGVTLYGITPARDAIITAVTPPEREGRTFGYFWTALLFITALYPTGIGYISDVAGIKQGFAYLGIGTLVAVLPLLVLRALYDHEPQ